VSGKGKANIATQGTFALGFPEFSDQHALARTPDVSASVVRFQQLMEDPNSPIRAVRRVPAKAAVTAPMPEPVAPEIRTALAQRGIRDLYSHQAECFDLIHAGKNVVVVTPTASGKTLCYNLPVLNKLQNEPGARAMYLFPTKALAEDQLHEFQAVVDAMGSDIKAFTYDGDTPQDARKAIRERANVVLTNPGYAPQRSPSSPYKMGEML
jgi:DEAD/DEAH box helicase domain-containing protein